MKKKTENQNSEIVVYNENNIQNGSDYYGDTFDNYNSVFEHISGLLPNNPELQKEINKYNAFTNLAKNVDKERMISEINLEEDVKEFLKRYNSRDTIKNYLAGINKFQGYCNERGLIFVKVDIKNAQDYANELKSKYASRTVQIHISSLKSFFNFLSIRHYEIIPVNVFKDVKLDKIEDRFKKDKVTKHDVEVLKKYFKKINRLDYICVVELLYKYGWRVGIFENFKLDNDGSWESVSKTDRKKGKVTKKEMKQMLESGVLRLKIKSISAKIWAVTKRLSRDGKISCSFSCHDLRAARMWEDTKDVEAEKFLKVSRKYHKNPVTTLGYVDRYLDR